MSFIEAFGEYELEYIPPADVTSNSNVEYQQYEHIIDE